MLIFLLIIVIGGVLMVNGVRRQKRLSVLRRTPTTTVANLRALPVDPGASYELTGTVRAGPQGPMRAPLSGVPCVWFRVRVIDRSRRVFNYGRRSRNAVKDARTEKPFVLDDTTGKIVVYPHGADLLPGKSVLKQRELASGGPAGFRPDTLAGRVRSGALPGTLPALRLGGEYEYEEWILPDGAPAYALGSVQNTTGDLTLAGGHLVIGAGTEEEVSKGLRRGVLIGYAAGLPMILLSVAIVVLYVLAVLND